MIAIRDFLDTGHDDGSAYIGDPDAHLFVPVRPAPVMPPAQRPGLPDALLPLLVELHGRYVQEARSHHEASNNPARPDARPTHRKLALERVSKATVIVQCLRDAGHDLEAAMLRENAKALEEALHAVPADLEERMDLLDAALPGERA